MAKVLGPLGSSEARGSVGAYTYNTWRGLHTVKTRTAPDYTPGGAREAQKNLVQAAGQRWKTLSDAQRAAWDTYADTHLDLDWSGHDLRLPAYHWYVRINTRTQLTSDPWRDDPPAIEIDEPPTYTDIFNTPTEIEVDFDYSGAYPAADMRYTWWITQGLSAGRNPTLHDAHRHDWCAATETAMFFSGLPAGRYTIWVRLSHLQGTAGPFLRLPPQDLP
jgi:hypothetical protein